MRKVLAVCMAVFLLAGSVSADTFKILGSRALGMGGAAVAVVGDSTGNTNAETQYWNPAALGLHAGVSIDLPFGVQVEATGGILDSAKQISDSAQQFTDINNAQENGSAINLQQIKAFAQGIQSLQKLNKSGLGMLLGVNGGLNGAYGTWGLSANYFASVGVTPHVELVNLSLGTIALKNALHKLRGAGGLGGINLGDLQSLFGTQTTLTNQDIQNLISDPGTVTPSGSNVTIADGSLAAASQDLKATVDILVNQANVGLTFNGTTYTTQQIANALVNVAHNEGVSNADIKSTVDTIVTIQPLLQDILQSGNSSSFSNNNSNVTLAGIVYDEIALGHGMNAAFIDESLKNLYLGFNLKYLQGTVGYVRQYVFQGDVGDSKDLVSDMTKDMATSSSFGLDLGFLYDMKKNYKTRVGLLLRNLNNPMFTQPQSAIDAGVTDKYKLGTQARAGIAFWPFRPMTLALDYDLTQNETPVIGFSSRYVNAGLEYNIFNKSYANLALRGGVMKNLANSAASMAYTGGIALNLIHFVIDITGAISSETVEIDSGQSIPSSGAVNLSLGLTFGGEKKEPKQEEPKEEPKEALNEPPVGTAKKVSSGLNLAITDFESKGTSASDASVVTDFIRTDMVSNGYYNVLDRSNMETLLAEQKFQMSGCTTLECVANMGKVLNVQVVLTGSLSKLAEDYYITVSLVDVETGKVTKSVDQKAKTLDELRDVCRQIVEKITK
ncbi:MAG: conjugal transfer protein TraF [Elusimicrobia bacterium]|nr:conjugal transfer protein TraF [Candidatus Liberimonas magnetica]